MSFFEAEDIASFLCDTQAENNTATVTTAAAVINLIFIKILPVKKLNLANIAYFYNNVYLRW